MGKMKVDINCYLFAGILANVFPGMFDEWFSIKPIAVVQTPQFL